MNISVSVNVRCFLATVTALTIAVAIPARSQENFASLSYYPHDPVTTPLSTKLLKFPAGDTTLGNALFTTIPPIHTYPGLNLFEYDTTSYQFPIVNAFAHATGAWIAILELAPVPPPAQPLFLSVDTTANSIPAVTGADGLSFSRLETTGRLAALDATVVAHEAGHTILLASGITNRALLLPVTYGIEPPAVHEGTADFIAAIYTGDPRLGAYLYANPNGATSCQNSPQTYNFANLASLTEDPHLAGQIISGLLWDLHTSLGTDGDKIFAQSLHYWPSGPTFLSVADALRASARDYQGSAFLGSVNAALAARGMSGTSSPVAIVHVNHPANTNSGVFTVHAEGGLPPYHYHWSQVYMIGEDPYPVDYPSSDTTTVQIGFGGPTTATCVVTDSRDSVVSAQAGASPGSLIQPPTSLAINGPATIEPGAVASYTASSNAVYWEFPKNEWSWTKMRNGVAIRASYGDTLTTVDTQSFDLVLTIFPGATGIDTALTTVLHVNVVGALSASINAPASPVCDGSTVNLGANVSGGSPPYSYSWDCVIEGGSCRLSSTTSATTNFVMPANSDLGSGADISLGATDALGAHVAASAHVDATNCGGSGGGGGLRDSRAGLTLDLRTVGSVDISAYDVLGRKTMTIFRGKLGRGTHVIAVDPHLGMRSVAIIRAITPSGVFVIKRVAIGHAAR